MGMHQKNKLTWKKAIMSAIESFKDYKLDSVDEYKKLVPAEPFSHPLSKEFFTHIKENQYCKARTLLEMNPTLVYEFDERFQTALHWAAKRGYDKILILLIKHKANINYKDVSGRTPLWLA